VSIRIELELDTGEFTTRMLHAGESVRQFNQNLGDTYTRVRRVTEGSQGFLSTLRDITIVLGLAHQAFSNVRAVTTGWIGDIVKVNSEMERLTTLLKGMSTAADPVKDAASQLKYLRDFALQAPLSLQALTNSFVKMRATGIDPMKGALKSYVDAVAAAGGTDEQLNRVTIAITQMSGKGVIQMEELRQQLGEHIPRAVELMARATGLSMASLLSKISTGTVESKSTLEALQAEFERTFGGAASAQMNTFAGRIAQLKTILQNLALEAGGKEGTGGFFDNLKGQLKDLNEFLASPVASNFAKQLGEGLSTAVTWLRSGIEWIVRFRNELLLAAQVLAVAFAGKVLIGGLMSISAAIGMLVTEARTLTLAWIGMTNAMAQSQAIGTALVATGQMSGVAAGAAVAVRGLGAAISFAGVAMGTIASIALPLAGAVIATAAAFGLFSNKAKDAYQNLEQFGATSRQQVKDAEGYLRSLEARAKADNDFVDKYFSFGGEKIKQKYREFFGIPQLEATIKEVRSKIAAGMEDATKYEGDAIARKKTESIDAESEVVRRAYDAASIKRAEFNKQAIAAAAAANMDTVKITKDYQEQQKAANLRFYDDQIAIIERGLRNAEILGQTSDESQIRAAEKLNGELLAKKRQFLEAREAEEKRAGGVQQITKLPNMDQLLEKGRLKIVELKSEIVQSRAELGGAKGDVEKLIYAITEARRYGPVDNEEVKKTIDELQRVGTELEKIQAQVQGQKKLNSDLTSQMEKVQEEIVDAQSRGMSAYDKMAVKWKNGLYGGGSSTSVLQQMLAGIKQEAKGAEDAMSSALGDNMSSKVERLTGVLGGLKNAWLGVKGAALGGADLIGGSVAVAARFSQGGNNRTFMDRLVGQESSGNPFAKNPDSSALGLGQFIKSTWMEFLKEMHPELISSDQEKNYGLRTDAKLAREAIAWYSSRNVEKLDRAGIDTNDANVYLAHFLGPDGAIATLSKSMDTQLSSIRSLDAARAANQGVFSKLNTVGDLQTWAQQRFGTAYTAPRTGSGSSAEFDKFYSNQDPQQRALISESNRLLTERNRLVTDEKLSQAQRDTIANTQKEQDAQKGLTGEVAKYRALIASGEYGPDRDPESQRYARLIEQAEKYDQVKKQELETKRVRDQYDRIMGTEGNEGAAAAQGRSIAEREADLRRRFADESTFKPSNQFFRETATVNEYIAAVQKAYQIGKISAEKQEQDLTILNGRKKALTDLEVGSAIASEQEKTRQMEVSLLTQDQQREANFQHEVKRIYDMVKLVGDDAEQRAKIEETAQRRIRAYRALTLAEHPVAKQMREWADIGNQLARSFNGWMDQTTDKLAEMVVKGKFELQSLASVGETILKDMARMAIRYLAGSAFAGMGGGAGKTGSYMQGGTKVPVIGTPTRHGGGVINGLINNDRLFPASAWKNAVKQHVGGMVGFRSGEVPITAMKGEITGWPNQLRHAFGGGQSTTNNYNVNVSGGGGTPEQNQDLADRITKQLENVMGARAAKEIRQQQRPGGMLNQMR
jgi:tape measure domain-containing protein